MIEIERKFLLANDNWRDAVETTHHIRQGYLGDGRRIRIIDGVRAVLTVKGPVNYHPGSLERLSQLAELSQNKIDLSWLKDSWVQYWPRDFVAPAIFSDGIDGQGYEIATTKIILEWDYDESKDLNIGNVEIELANRVAEMDVLIKDRVAETVFFDLKTAEGWHQLVEAARAYLPQSFAQQEDESDMVLTEALTLLEHQPTLSKIRHIVPQGRHKWEIDVFEDVTLVMAEIELTYESEYFDKPEWLGAEVTSQKEYGNYQILKSLIKKKAYK